MEVNLALLVAASNATDTEVNPASVAMHAKLRSTREKIANSAVKGLDASLYTTYPRNIVDSGASKSFVTNEKCIANARKHNTTLLKADGNTSNSTHSGKLQITEGNTPLFLPALVVPNFKDNLISVGQISKSNNILYTEEGVYLMPKDKANRNAKFVGGASHITCTLYLIVAASVSHRFIQNPPP